MSSIIRGSDNFDPQDLGAVSALDTITEAYLSGLGTGTDGQAVFSDGAGNFEWADVPIKFLGYHTDNVTGTIYTTSTDWQNTGLSVTFTPQSASSVFIVFVTHTSYLEDDAGTASIETQIRLNTTQEYYAQHTKHGTNNNRGMDTQTHHAVISSIGTDAVTIDARHQNTNSLSNNYWNYPSTSHANLTVIEVLA